MQKSIIDTQKSKYRESKNSTKEPHLITKEYSKRKVAPFLVQAGLDLMSLLSQSPERIIALCLHSLA
jgi:hypothetical protein